MYVARFSTLDIADELRQSKAECTAPRKFTGECRNCGQQGIASQEMVQRHIANQGPGHMSSECPTRVVKCKNCEQDGEQFSFPSPQWMTDPSL